MRDTRYWMEWTVERSSDPFGVQYYRAKYQGNPSRAEVPMTLADEDVRRLAETMGVSPEAVQRTKTCLPGVIRLGHDPEPEPVLAVQ